MHIYLIFLYLFIEFTDFYSPVEKSTNKPPPLKIPTNTNSPSLTSPSPSSKRVNFSPSHLTLYFDYHESVSAVGEAAKELKERMISEQRREEDQQIQEEKEEPTKKKEPKQQQQKRERTEDEGTSEPNKKLKKDPASNSNTSPTTEVLQ